MESRYLRNASNRRFESGIKLGSSPSEAARFSLVISWSLGEKFQFRVKLRCLSRRKPYVTQGELHYRRNGHLISTEGADNHLPVDDIEPQMASSDAFRDACVKFVRLLNATTSYIEAPMSRYGAPKEVQTAFWQVCYALGLNICAGMSMTERSKSIGIERATLSKGARAFCQGNDLPPSQYMKDAESEDAYRDGRLKSIRKHQ
jgi:hypothetical protein